MLSDTIPVRKEDVVLLYLASLPIANLSTIAMLLTVQGRRYLPQKDVEFRCFLAGWVGGSAVYTGNNPRI